MNKVASILLGTILTLPLMTGCAARRGVYVRTYGPAEAPYYAQWEHDTHRQHMDYDRRKSADQHQYWEWRQHHQNHN